MSDTFVQERVLYCYVYTVEFKWWGGLLYVYDTAQTDV